VVIEDEEAHSEEAASAANKAQLPTEDEDWLDADEDVEEHHDEDVELPRQLQPTQYSSPLTQTVSLFLSRRHHQRLHRPGSAPGKPSSIKRWICLAQSSISTVEIARMS
jgi:hypothetical protein